MEIANRAVTCLALQTRLHVLAMRPRHSGPHFVYAHPLGRLVRVGVLCELSDRGPVGGDRFTTHHA